MALGKSLIWGHRSICAPDGWLPGYGEVFPASKSCSIHAQHRKLGHPSKLPRPGSHLADRLSRRADDKQVDEGIWLASFMHYDLGYFDLEQKTLQPLDNPFGTRLSPMS
jgi:hypothetical protein